MTNSPYYKSRTTDRKLEKFNEGHKIGACIITIIRDDAKYFFDAIIC